jgi:sn-glycerol 3-phosphate transport system ATP-binding protein
LHSPRESRNRRSGDSHAVPALGATIHVTPRPDRLHLFDAKTGKRV